ncbi:MAG TPA: serine hydrolase domain-containing protein [Holophagaceae bacterium]|nr:serine hydrolase domain-containing protein [Holophagaceae bacterium]
MRLHPIALLALAPALLAQAPLPPERIPTELDALLSRTFKADAPGAAVLVLRGGKVVLRKGYGLASVELGVPMAPDAVLHVASVGKQFTAVAMLRLAEQGKVDLQAPLATYLPDAPPAWSGITLAHLLTHTSGIDNLWNDPGFRAHEREDWTPAQLYAWMKTKPLASAPGTRFAYATANYTLLAMVIEKVTGTPYAAHLEATLLKPLGMSRTTFDQAPQLVKGLAHPYAGGPRPAPFMSPALGFGGGSYFSTTEDLARWSAALHGGKLLKPETYRAMTTPFRLPDGTDTHYGYGLRPHTFRGEAYLQANGDIPGFHSEVVVLPTSDVFVAVLSNSEDLPTGLDPLAKRLAAIATGLPYTEPAAVTLSAADLQRLCGRYAHGTRIRTLRLDKGRLVSAFPGSDPDPITPISATEFRFDEEPDLRLRFQLKDGQPVAVQVTAVDRMPGPTYVRMADQP